MAKTRQKYRELSGLRFYRLTVIKRDSEPGAKHVQWLCRCDCGSYVKAQASNLTSGKHKSCGCLIAELTSHNFKDLRGTRFSRLVVVRRVDRPRGQRTRWLCRCDCGGLCEVDADNLTAGRQKSCGCLGKEMRLAHIEARRTSDAEKRRVRQAAQKRYNSSEKGRAAQKRYMGTHREAAHERAKKWGQENPEVRRSSVRNRRAKIKSIGGSHTSDDVKRLGSEQDWKCAGCRSKLGRSYHVDHVVPVTKGGHNGPDNLQLLCPKCNGQKFDKDLLVFLAELHPQLFSQEAKCDAYDAYD